MGSNALRNGIGVPELHLCGYMEVQDLIKEP